jgi:hypothetical protein
MNQKTDPKTFDVDALLNEMVKIAPRVEKQFGDCTKADWLAPESIEREAAGLYRSDLAAGMDDEQAQAWLFTFLIDHLDEEAYGTDLGQVASVITDEIVLAAWWMEPTS